MLLHLFTFLQSVYKGNKNLYAYHVTEVTELDMDAIYRVALACCVSTADSAAYN